MKFSLFFLLILQYLNISAQEDSSYFYLGSLSYGDDNIISYKLQFTVNRGVLKGFSTYDFYGKNSTKSRIEGVLSKNGKRLSFKEVKKISSNSVVDDSSFCFVTVSDLRIKKIIDYKIINGVFIGEFPNGNQCASGTISLASNIEKELKLFEGKIINYEDSTGRIILPENLDSIVKKFNFKKVDSSILNSNLPLTKLKILKKGINETIIWPSNIIYIQIWDGSTEDGDIINIYFNEELIEKNIEIKKEQKIFAFPFEQDSAIFKIEAVDNGSLGINTVNLLLKNNINARPYITKLRQDQTVEITFKK